MKKLLFVLVIAMLLCLTALADEAAPLTVDELMGFCDAAVEDVLARAPVAGQEAEDGGYVFDYGDLRIYTLDSSFTAESRVTGVELLGENEDLDAPHGVALGSTLYELLPAYPLDNENLAGDYDGAVLYISGLLPGTVNDGYAVSEIDQILDAAEPFTPSQLTAEEKKQGFEMLFDGTNLDKWQGDLEGYIPVNGTIYVSANYGSTGNLYTKKEYRNFVYRFEFCFLREGVNNGVGVRTPMGVDAAYDAMCEVQILDHDAPMYANLREYQVHGSVYGVIPAKRIVHKALGEWSTEEIRVEGDRIKVTVNGEVIVDGNIRTACKGHNVAPDGSDTNPYTVDHRNHPGMFNKKGYISFCGHGEGLKIRNVRILDLGDKK